MEILIFLIILLAPSIIIAIKSKDDLPENLVIEKAIAPALIWAIASLAVSVVVAVFSYIQARKMQKKNGQKANQLDGTIADEGTSFSDIAGSPQMYGNITHLFGQNTTPIKQKNGGFLGIGSSSQVTGYRYFTNFLMFIGNPIEKMLGINFDKRGWISPFVDENGNALAQGVINSPNLYGENEGGVAGAVHVQYGRDNQEVLPFYKAYMDSKEIPASAFPYQSYLAFTGLGKVNTGNGWIDGAFGALAGHMNEAFYVGNSGYMKEMLLWPKRIHVRNDGRAQWYDLKAEIGIFYDNSLLPPEDDFYDSTFTAITNDVYGNIGSYDNLVKNAMHHNFGDFPVKGSVFSTELTFPVGGNVELIFGVLVDNIDVKVSTSHYSISYAYDANWQSSVTTYNTIAIVRVWSVGGFKVIVSAESNEDWSQQALLGSKFTATDMHFNSAEDAPDINSIHKIREILTDDTAMSKPESSINDLNFMKAADCIYDEGLGISWSITEKSCIDAINELCYHIEAGIRVNRQTGLYEMVLFRDDWFEEDEIHSISESKIKSMQYEITNADEVINQVNVNFYDRANIKNSSFSISESGLIQTLGRVNAETVDFPYFMNMRNAEIVANWKLKLLSTGVYKGSFTTGWREARKWNRYDLIKLPWSKRWSGTILVRIMSINLGGPTNNEVSIDFIEVVPSTGMMNTTIVADDVIDKPLPPQACEYEPFELPYYLAAMRLGQRQVDEELAYDSNFGLVGVVAEKPQENSLYAVMMTNNYDEWVRAGSIQYSATADLDQIISKTSSSFIVKNWKKIANIPAGTLLKCGRDWLGTPGEWMVLQSIDPYTGIVSVKRGALDTQPQGWGGGTKLYFCGNDISYDQTEYVSGEEVLVSALTTTPSGVLEQAGSIPVEMKARAIRPYPPANVKINSDYWLEEIETDLVLTWVDRNRTQQTGGEIIGWYEGGVTIEAGVSTLLVLTQYDENHVELATNSANVSGTNTFLFPISSMQADTQNIEIVLKTVRDGYECLHPFVHTVELSQFFSAPYDLTVEFKND